MTLRFGTDGVRGVANREVTVELDRAGIRWRPRNPAGGVFRAPQVAFWTAHYTGRPHLCGPECGFGMPVRAAATQWRTSATLDESLCSPGFL